MKTKNIIMVFITMIIFAMGLNFAFNANANANSQELCNHYEPAVNDCITPPLSCGCTIVVTGHKGHQISSDSN